MAGPAELLLTRHRTGSMLSGMPSGPRPSWPHLLEKLGRWSIVPFILVSLVSAYLVSRIPVSDASWSLDSPDPELEAAAELERYFVDGNDVLVSFESDRGYDPYLSKLFRDAETALAAIDGVERVLSPADLETALRSEPEGSEASPAGAQAGSGGERSSELIARVSNALRGSAGLSRLFRSEDSRAWNLYIGLSEEARSGYERTEAVLSSISEALGRIEPRRFHVTGRDWMDTAVERRTRTEFPFLLAGGIALVFAAQLFLTAHVRTALSLLIACLMPVLWTLGLISASSAGLTDVNLFIPIQVLALATSYGIHFVRFYAAEAERNTVRTLAVITPVILLAGLTTLAGFLPFQTSWVPQIRLMGRFLVFGIAAALCSALLLLPPLLRGFVRGAKVRREPSFDPLFRFVSGRTGLILAGWLVVSGAALCGAALLFHSTSVSKFFRPSTPEGRTLRYVSDRYGTIESVSLILDSNTGYGAVDPGFFSGVEEFIRFAETLPGVLEVNGYTTLVRAYRDVTASGAQEPPPDAALDPAAAGRPVEPRLDETAIGETLELLSAGGGDFGIGRFIDPGYRRVKLEIRLRARLEDPRRQYREYTELRRTLPGEAKRLLPGAAAVMSGPVELTLAAERRVLDELLQSALLVIPVFFCMLVLVFRSVTLPLIALIPPLSGFALFFGLMGLLSIPVGLATPFAGAAIIGVSIDDVYCLLYFYHRMKKHGADGPAALRGALAHSGFAILGTTLLIDAGLLVLPFSGFRHIVELGLLTSAGLSFATAVTLVFIPSLLILIERRNPDRTGHTTRNIPETKDSVVCS